MINNFYCWLRRIGSWKIVSVSIKRANTEYIMVQCCEKKFDHTINLKCKLIITFFKLFWWESYTTKIVENCTRLGSKRKRRSITESYTFFSSIQRLLYWQYQNVQYYSKASINCIIYNIYKCFYVCALLLFY